MTDEFSSSTASNSAPADHGPHEFMRTWAESMAQVLGQIAGSALPVESVTAAPPEAPVGEDSDLQVVVVVAGALRGEMSLRIPRPSALAMAQIFLGEEQSATVEFKPEHREAVEELLRQIAGYVATAWKPVAEVQFHLESSSPPSWSPGASGWLRSTGDTSSRIGMEWHLSAALHAALAAAPTSPQSQPPEPRVAGQDAELPPNSGIVEQNLSLLMDVELEVMLRFGERNMLLRDILELGAGAVVELDRQVEEPVDLLLDGKVIARGEVVVVDGNYGLRVLELLLPQLAG